MRRLFDERGKEIHPYDIIKVYHFTDYKNRKRYMYKQVGVYDDRLFAFHLGKTDPYEAKGYVLAIGADESGKIEGTRIVQGKNV